MRAAARDPLDLPPTRPLASVMTMRMLSQRSWKFPAARVLVVDDGLENRELVKLVLEEFGLTVGLKPATGASVADMGHHHQSTI